MSKATFSPVTPQVDFPKLEEEILQFWKKEKIFEKSLVKDTPKGKWNFLDGPPFITGLPHYGSLLSSIPKDLFPRFKTMQGYRVRRVWGWDCHGLPAENKVENKLGIKSKKEIVEKIGVKKFIDECKAYVSEVSGEWEWYVDHVGRWVDFKNAYKTMDMQYMESVMWVFKQMYDKGLIYKGLRVSLYCPHCETPISNFEVAMDADNYKEITGFSAVYKYKLKTQNDNSKLHENTYLLAWSTTPWNKLVTPALAVHPKLAYVKVKQNDECYILAKSTLKMLEKKSHPEHSEGSPEKTKEDSSASPQNDNFNKYTILEEFKGSSLVGLEFEPHYDFYAIDPGKKAFIVVAGDFVTADEGTGIVTLAAYGEEDLVIMQKENIQIVMHIDDKGHLKPFVPKWGGMHYVKVNKLVNEDLRERGLLYKEESYKHTVAHCWRCSTQLFYNPQDAWYVDIQSLKPKLKQINENIAWFPSHFKYGRFLKSMEAAPDWCISRNRFWGSPVPVWECECGQRFVPGSIKELEEASAKQITDLHKPEIDAVAVPCKKCGKTTKRVSEVLDSWIEAGSAPYAERHFPFEEKLKLGDFFPPDFIVEYTGQIRAWFYVLHVIATALFDSHAFKNVVVTGVILGSDGRKMSKNYGNYPDPKEMLQKYGGDALRLYLMGSPVMRGEDILISEEQYRHQVRGLLLILWNSYNFFVTYANVDSWSPSEVRNSEFGIRNVLDRWILSLLHQLIQDVTRDMESFDTVSVIEKLKKFIDDFSTWYIRRSRDRVGPLADDTTDKEAFYTTCHEVLVVLCKLLAPIIPFTVEAIYKNLTQEESVHLALWPTPEQSRTNKELTQQMALIRKIVELGHARRKEAGIRVKQPLQQFTVHGSQFTVDERLFILIKDELNVKEIVFKKGDGEITVDLDTIITDVLRKEGEARDIIRKIQEERKKLGTALDEKVYVELPQWPNKFEEEIKQRALVQSLQKGDQFLVKRL